MKKLIFLLVMASFQVFASEGTIIIAHGSMQGCGLYNPSSWETEVHKIINQVESKTDKNIQVAFGMWNTKCYDEAIEVLRVKMQRKGEELTTLNVLPLFLSSHSLVIEMQKYIFKKVPTRVIPMPMAMPTKFQGEINYLPALDYSPHLAMIMANRAHGLIHLAKDQGYKKSQMEIVFTMHGPVRDSDNTKWIEMAEQYKKDITYLFPTANFHIISLRDDAEDDVRDAATKELQTIVQTAKDNGNIALILPYLLSKGGIENGIKARLKGLDYIWSGETILPDMFFIQVILERLNKL